jgi:hypothetical protein
MSSSNTEAYDKIMGMGMGMDLMISIGSTVDCEQRCINWFGTETPLKTKNRLSDNDILHMLYIIMQQLHPYIPQEAEKIQHTSYSRHNRLPQS